MLSVMQDSRSNKGQQGILCQVRACRSSGIMSILLQVHPGLTWGNRVPLVHPVHPHTSDLPVRPVTLFRLGMGCRCRWSWSSGA
jgi:hypothetical protein